VGRDDEVAALDRLLTAPETRLLTLTGPPGVGKTRLAIAVAAAAAPRFPDGVAFVDLTDIQDPPLVAAAVLEATGSSDVGRSEAAEQLGRALAGRTMLLVVDNFEHVLDAGLVLATALTGCAGLRLLLTSRERLHLRAEREIPVRPLGLPRDDDPAGSSPAPALEMLVQCVRRFDPGFDVTPDNCAALAEICARLDGLPLALELAAARLKLFTPGELTFRLRHRMSILVNTVRDVPRRHRTLRAALAWSHDLLKPDERAAFRRLSVFVGGATLDAAGQVCDLDDPVATITSLVDKSLLHRRIRPDGVAEFAMLQSLREYAAELLVEHGEEETFTVRHTRYFVDLAVLAETAIGETAEAPWMDSVGFEQGNLRKALTHATSAADASLSLPLGSALGWYAYTRGRLGDGVATTLDRVLVVANPGQPQGADDSLSSALLIAAVLALGRGDLDDADTLLTRVLSVDIDQRNTAIARAFLGHVAGARGHHDQAVGHHARAAELFSELGNTPGVAWSRYDLALLARHRGDADGAAGHLRESLTRFREMGDARAVECATWALLTVELRRERVDGTERLLAEARGCRGAPPHGPGVATCLGAVSVMGCGCRKQEAARFPRPARTPETPRKLSAIARIARTRDGYALPGDSLTVREQQVARLVACGSTNRQIGRVLGIAEKTTETHVHNIIQKLGARNRAEVAARVSAAEQSG
jgi:predicted ATPase/DNA-binding CsgD family transcriptional regulator